MKASVLRKLIETEIKAVLNEETMVEPSEQIMKGMLKVLKAKTGIIAMPVLVKTTPKALYYSADFAKELRTPILQSAFNSMTLDVTCRELPGAIGGYAFDVSVNWTHPQGGSNGKNIGTIFFQDNKFSSRIL